jgi:endonuclease III related protein
MSVSRSDKCIRIVSGLSRQYGEIDWWPGDTEEVMIGAILTQQTRWENVERAIRALKEAGLCSIQAIHRSSPGQIEDLIRCSGFYRVKTRRLFHLASHILDTYGGIPGMHERPTGELRTSLLSVHGIGEETADSILCYGLNRTSFVIDAYTIRLCRCAGIQGGGTDLKSAFEEILPARIGAYRQAHAHIVEYAKDYCQKKRCDTCWVRNLNG